MSDIREYLAALGRVSRMTKEERKDRTRCLDCAVFGRHTPLRKLNDGFCDFCIALRKRPGCVPSKRRRTPQYPR